MKPRELYRGIADAIREKDGTSEPIVAESFPERIRAIPAGGSVDAPDPMEVYRANRPADWLPMPEPQDNEMYLLFHIPDGASSFLAFMAMGERGECTVSLGSVQDGVFTAQSAVETAGGVYDAELHASDFGNLTSDGFKQVMVKISCAAGDAISTWQVSWSALSGLGTYSWNIKEVSCKLPSAQFLDFGDYTGFDLPVPGLALEQLRYVSVYRGSANQGPTTCLRLFCGCVSLEAVLHLDTGTDDSLEGIFMGCKSLVAIPQLDLNNARTVNSMFYGCTSLTTIPALNLGHVENAGSMFCDCTALNTVPALDLSGATYLVEMFKGCSALKRVADLNIGKAKNLEGIFQDCTALATAPWMDLSSATSLKSAFRGCTSLTTLPEMDTSKVNTADNIFQDCVSLIVAPSWDMTNTKGITGMFKNCNNLVSIGKMKLAIDGLPTNNKGYDFTGCTSLSFIAFSTTGAEGESCNISLANCALSHTALVALFESLPTITVAKTLTITGNPGAAALTEEEKAIATGKNWTLVT